MTEGDFAKRKELFLEQKKTLDTFLKTGAISRLQYDKSYGDLVKKMGMESVAEILGYYNGLKDVCIYESEHCDVYYIEYKNVVLVHWKNYCELKAYREPLECALNIIKEHPGCNYVADTRDGFEDNPLDTKWVAEYFMPRAKEYGCRIIYFIIDEENSLKDELEGQEKNSDSILEFKYIYSIEAI